MQKGILAEGKDVVQYYHTDTSAQDAKSCSGYRNMFLGWKHQFHIEFLKTETLGATFRERFYLLGS